MNAKISVFVTCVEIIVYLLLYYLHEYIFKCYDGNALSGKMENEFDENLIWNNKFY